jgi:predicted nuclease with TOPRIM domain
MSALVDILKAISEAPLWLRMFAGIAASISIFLYVGVRYFGLEFSSEALKSAKVKAKEKEVESDHEISLLKQIRDQYNTLKDQQEDLRTKLESYRKDFYELKVENQSIRAENETIRRENTELQKSNERLERNNKRLEKIVMFLKDRFDRLVNIILDKDIETANLPGTIKDHQEEVENLLEDKEISGLTFEEGQFAQPDS